MQEEREPTLWDEIDDAVSLSRTQRIYGFAICAATGMILGFLVRYGDVHAWDPGRSTGGWLVGVVRG